MPLNTPDNKGAFEAQLRAALDAPRLALDNIQSFRAYLYSLAPNGTDAEVLTLLQAAPFLYSAEDATTIRSAVNALNQLAIVAKAGATVGAPDDFFFHAKKVLPYTPRR